jgi:hypothetical protein
MKKILKLIGITFIALSVISVSGYIGFLIGNFIGMNQGVLYERNYTLDRVYNALEESNTKCLGEIRLTEIILNDTLN